MQATMVTRLLQRCPGSALHWTTASPSIRCLIASACPAAFRSMKTTTYINTFPPLIDSEIEETFIKGSLQKIARHLTSAGSGKGGQAINKRSTNVSLIHRPTGLRVTCQDTRSLETNRLLARKRLVEKIDMHLNGDKSVLALKAADASRKKARLKAQKRRKREKKLAAKAGGVIEEDEEDVEDDDELDGATDAKAAG